MVAKGCSPCPGQGICSAYSLLYLLFVFIRWTHIMERMELLVFSVSSTLVSPQVLKKSWIRCKGVWVYFLYCHKALNPTSVLPLTVHVCMSPEVGRIFSSSLQKLMMFLPGDSSAVLFMKGALHTLYFNSSGTKSCSRAELWTCTI